MRALIAVVMLSTILGGVAAASPFRESLTTLQKSTADRAAFFSRCDALSKIFWVGSDFWNGSETFRILNVSPDRLFIKLARDGFFAKEADFHAFLQVGSDWETIWRDGQKSGKGLPFWAVALVMGVDALTHQNALAYKQMLQSDQSNEATKTALLGDLKACEEAAEYE